MKPSHDAGKQDSPDCGDLFLVFSHFPTPFSIPTYPEVLLRLAALLSGIPQSGAS